MDDSRISEPFFYHRCNFIAFCPCSLTAGNKDNVVTLGHIQIKAAQRFAYYAACTVSFNSTANFFAGSNANACVTISVFKHIAYKQWCNAGIAFAVTSDKFCVFVDCFKFHLVPFLSEKCEEMFPFVEISLNRNKGHIAWPSSFIQQNKRTNKG